VGPGQLQDGGQSQDLDEKPGTLSPTFTHRPTSPPLGRREGLEMELIIDYVFVITDYTSFKSPK